MKLSSFAKQLALCLSLALVLLMVARGAHGQKPTSTSSSSSTELLDEGQKGTYQFNGLEMLAINALSRIRELYGDNWLNQLMVALAFPLLAPLLMRSAEIRRSITAEDQQDAFPRPGMGLVPNVYQQVLPQHHHQIGPNRFAVPIGPYGQMKMRRAKRAAPNDPRVQELVQLIEQLDQFYRKYHQ